MANYKLLTTQYINDDLERLEESEKAWDYVKFGTNLKELLYTIEKDFFYNEGFDIRRDTRGIEIRNEDTDEVIFYVNFRYYDSDDYTTSYNPKLINKLEGNNSFVELIKRWEDGEDNLFDNYDSKKPSPGPKM